MQIKVATSIGFYYMSNACGRFFDAPATGEIYTYGGEDLGEAAGSDGLRGLALCFIAGTVSSLAAALITLKIKDQQAGLHCGPCVCVQAMPAPVDVKVSCGITEDMSATKPSSAIAADAATAQLSSVTTANADCEQPPLVTVPSSVPRTQAGVHTSHGVAFC